MAFDLANLVPRRATIICIICTVPLATCNPTLYIDCVANVQRPQGTAIVAATARVTRDRTHNMKG